MTSEIVATDRYRAVGLTGNPFTTRGHDEHAAECFVPRGIDDPPPPGARTLVQVIGPSGWGKTSHVGHWRRITPGPYHYVPRRPYAARWVAPPIGDLVYGDEIDRMPRPLRRRWLRQLARIGATVVIGTHADLSSVAARAGLDVVTHRLGPIDRPTLDAIIAARLASAAVSDRSPTFAFADEELALIHAKSRGSVRAAEVYCHELLAERVLEPIGVAMSAEDARSTAACDSIEGEKEVTR